MFRNASLKVRDIQFLARFFSVKFFYRQPHGGYIKIGCRRYQSPLSLVLVPVEEALQIALCGNANFCVHC